MRTIVFINGSEIELNCEEEIVVCEDNLIRDLNGNPFIFQRSKMKIILKGFINYMDFWNIGDKIKIKLKSIFTTNQLNRKDQLLGSIDEYNLFLIRKVVDCFLLEKRINENFVTYVFEEEL